jgi:hypothetical protein
LTTLRGLDTKPMLANGALFVCNGFVVVPQLVSGALSTEDGPVVGLRFPSEQLSTECVLAIITSILNISCTNRRVSRVNVEHFESKDMETSERH